ncbi:multiple epidermal growth factor-like domains protein 6 [Crotalus adamanteus]|uniref:Multiple epidermal growth factor-like domains protein 6 n=1 Tax=Crotalus adamanteus TaxID=8729 RepID=A0AAW1AZI2_CROAD
MYRTQMMEYLDSLVPLGTTAFQVTTAPQAVKSRLPVFLAPIWQRPMEKNGAPHVQKGSTVYLVICHSYVPKNRLALALLAITVQGAPLSPILVQWGHLLLDQGYIRSTPGLPAPTGPCEEGFFCILGSVLPNPLTTSQSGGPCPQGYFCPQGTANPLPCPAGSYNNLEKQASCLPCPDGYFCLQNSSSLVNSKCPVGHYCPLGTMSENQFPCPQGTYNPNVGISDLSLCLLCTPGHYCGFPGQAQVTGLCSAGYYCLAATLQEIPNWKTAFCVMQDISVMEQGLPFLLVFVTQDSIAVEELFLQDPIWLVVLMK